jgi:hypothetical protein
MRVRRLVAAIAVTAAVACSVVGCTDANDEPAPPASPEPSPSVTDSPTASAATSSPTASDSAPTGGTSEAPAVADAQTDLLDWQPIPGPPDDTITTNGDWTLTVGADGDRYDLDGHGTGKGFGLRSRDRVSDALLSQDWAVVVVSDRQETRPALAEVTELGTNKVFRVGARSDPPTIPGGTWALGDDIAAHATVTADGRYCLAIVDLETRKSRLSWCAEPHHGFNAARISDAGISLLTFDDASPSCRTVVTVEGDAVEPFPGVTPCKGWEGVVTDGGAVWSIVPKENRVEQAHFYARVGESYFDLGPGTSGTLTPCAGAAYFVRDPQREGEPARLMRWDGSTLAAVYESPGGQAFLAAPRCGGTTLNVSAFSESGDEQVWAEVADPS